ncbi:MAG: dipeptidase [Clostridia bacterium]|nr:dipeptidase [Clostridia bacterium]MBQ1434479.1 dipeptidase [Clostridia bacterium]MBQ4248464.1 dipeptidase [Clostridia bacterium]
MIRYFDAHCDTVTRTADAGLSMYENDMHISFSKLRRFKNYAGIFAIWQDDTKTPEEAYEGFFKYYDYFVGETKKYKDIVTFCKSRADYDAAVKAGKIAAILSIEGGLPLNGDTGNLDKFHEMGVRLMTLTWNRYNGIADGITEETGRGLTDFGRKVVERMGKLNMLIDVSHLSVRGFYDVMEAHKGIVVASHSNSIAECSHRRNLTDEQFGLLKASGGGCGINLYADFISDRTTAHISDVVRHIEHFMALGGEDSLFIGADFDGIERTVKGLEDVVHIENLYEELLKLNYKEKTVKKLFYDNLERIMLTVL